MDQIVDFGNQVMNIISLYGPSVVSIITMIASVLLAVKKFRDSARDSFTEIQKTTNEIRNSNKDVKELKMECAAIMRQNTALQEELNNTINEINTNVSGIKTEIDNIKKL